MKILKSGEIAIVTEQGDYYGYQIKLTHNCFTECKLPEGALGCGNTFFPIEGVIYLPDGGQVTNYGFVVETDVADMSAS